MWCKNPVRKIIRNPSSGGPKPRFPPRAGLMAPLKVKRASERVAGASEAGEVSEPQRAADDNEVIVAQAGNQLTYTRVQRSQEAHEAHRLEP